MERKEWTQRALAAARALGCTDAEVFCAEHDAFSASVLSGELERYSVSKTGGISLRVQWNGRDGHAYTESLDDPEEIAARATENARCLETTQALPLQTAQFYQEVGRPVSPLDTMDAGEKIALALALEARTLAVDARVEKVVFCCVQTGTGSAWLENTRGLVATRETGSALCYVEPYVRQGDEVQTGSAFRMGVEAADIDGCAREAVADALSRLGGAPVASGEYAVIIKNMAMAELLSAFSGIFSAEQAQRGCSLLAGREGDTIAADCVTLIDDPFDPIAPRAFDGEGTPCRSKRIIDGGTFVTLLHNLKTAKKAGCASTGNAVRASAAAPVDVGPFVLRLAAGAETFDALVQRMGDGLIITDLQGLHAGLNPVSGDFSLKATGRRIEHGADVGAVSGITLAGNFLALLRGVCAVGSDVRFAVPGSFYAASPSVLIERLNVAGI